MFSWIREFGLLQIAVLNNCNTIKKPEATRIKKNLRRPSTHLRPLHLDRF